MSLYSYASACSGLVTELTDSLSEEDLNELRKDCKSLGLKRWYAWQSDNLELVFDYLRATPSVRNKKKVWRDPTLRRRLVLACIGLLLRGQKLLTAADWLALKVGSPYREMGQIAAEKYLEILSEPIERWPLDGPSPFA